jgi:hypothetical protein
MPVRQVFNAITIIVACLASIIALDAAVDKCYRGTKFSGETERLEFLFALYNEIAAPLAPAEKPQKRRRRHTS